MTTAARDQLAAVETAEAAGVPANRAKTILDEIRDLAPQLTMATRGTPMDPDRFIRVAITEMRRTPLLVQCTRDSILGGLMLSAQLGLEVGRPLGQSWLIPFKNHGTYEAQWILGYTGVVTLAARSGVSIIGRAVHEADEFDLAYDADGDRLTHRPALRGERGDAWLYYAVARWDGGHAVMPLSRSDVERYRARSKAKNSGPWVTDFDAMALKTCALRLRPWIPLQAQAADAMTADGEVARGIDVDLSDVAIEAAARELAAGESGGVADGGEDPTEPGTPAPDPPAVGSDEAAVPLPPPEPATPEQPADGEQTAGDDKAKGR